MMMIQISQSIAVPLHLYTAAGSFIKTLSVELECASHACAVCGSMAPAFQTDLSLDILECASHACAVCGSMAPAFQTDLSLDILECASHACAVCGSMAPAFQNYLACA